MKEATKREEARELLQAFGLSKNQQNDISAYTLLALVQLRPENNWSQARRERLTITKGIMSFIAQHYGVQYAANTRETVRRQVLHQFVLAGIAQYNPFEPDLPTNSPHAHYAISPMALAAIQKREGDDWMEAVNQFLQANPIFNQNRIKHRSPGKLIPVRLPDGTNVVLSPGNHNLLQRLIIENFAPRFAPSAQVIYLGDTANKALFIDVEKLESFGLFLNIHEKLPDIILWDSDRKWLFLIEAVASHGPMNTKRVKELGLILSQNEVGLIFVSAFLDMKRFRQHISQIAWETEVWIAEMPEHMIHFNGDRFIGPHSMTE